jgi:hypothetical protein
MTSIAPDGVLGVSMTTSEVAVLEPAQSAVSWPAVIAGGFVAASASLVLTVLGSGFGLAAASPWSGAHAETFAVTAGIWLIVTQWVAAGLGGYLTGRLRTRWASVHTHEVFFRDTAHGFLTWALATVMVVVLVTTAGLIAAASTTQDAGGPYAYQVDTLFRSVHPDAGLAAMADRAEASRILARQALPGGVSDDDRAYLAHLVALRADVPAAVADQRTDTAITAVKTAADNARKAGAATSFFAALSLIIGAFIASVAAALGGQQRDEHP